MATAQRVLDVARGQIGQGESPRGSNQTSYGAWYGVNGVPWCCEFVCWTLFQAGAGNLVAGARTAKGAAYSGDIYDWFNRQGRVSMTPQVGDLVIWDWPGVGTNNDHIGFVEVVYPNSIGTIEGNSPTVSGGADVVGRHIRDIRRSVHGYCHPAYSADSPTPLPKPPPRPAVEEDDMSMFIRGDASPTVYERSGVDLRPIKSEATLMDLWGLGFGHQPLQPGHTYDPYWVAKGVAVVVAEQRLIDELL